MGVKNCAARRGIGVEIEAEGDVIEAGIEVGTDEIEVEKDNEVVNEGLGRSDGETEIEEIGVIEVIEVTAEETGDQSIDSGTVAIEGMKIRQSKRVRRKRIRCYLKNQNLRTIQMR